MFDIPMKSSGALSLSSLDSSNFSKTGNNQQANTKAVNSYSNQTSEFGNQQSTPVQNQGFSTQQPQAFGGQQPQAFGGQQPQAFGGQQPQAFGGQQPQAFGGQRINQAPVQQMPKQRPSGNGVILKKGQKTSLSRMNPNLDLIEVGLGWDLGPNGQGYDLDVEAFLLNQSGKVIGDDWFVFYNQPVSPDGSVRLLGDSTTGAGAGDDEVIQVKLSQVNNNVSKIVFIVTINDAKQYGYNFSNITNAYVRIVDKSSGNELIRFNLTDYYNTVCSMMVGEVYKHNGEWKFSPIGDGTGDDLEGLCIRYGVNVAG